MGGTDYTVVMVVRNGSRLIAEALASIREQEVPPAQVLIVDDGSEDETCEIARRLMPDARVVSFAQAGMGASLNRARALISSDLVAFLDHDDLWEPGKAAWQVPLLADAQGPAVVVGAVVNATERDGVIVRREAMGPARVLGACMMTRTTLDAVGPFLEDNLHHTIVDWWSRADIAGVPTTTVDRPALIRRIHGGNMGITRKADSDAHLLRHLRAHRQRRPGGSGDGC
jgi:glycosyltransferase involved in cell wall biosynthesis